jgi:hypothetical protein
VTLRFLLALPLALAAAIAVGATGLDAPAQVGALYLSHVAAKALACAGCLVAARAFERGSRLWTAWSLYAGGYALIAVKSVPALAAGAPLLAPLATAVAYVLNPAATFLLVRAWDGSGLAPAIGAWRQRILLALAFAVAVAIAGPGIALLSRGLAGHPQRLLLALSGLGDVAQFTLLAPLLLIALALRGGVLAWPWGLLAASVTTWLAYDLLTAVAPSLWAPAVARAIPEALRIVASLLIGAAGVAQWLATRAAATAGRARSAA